MAPRIPDVFYQTRRRNIYPPSPVLPLRRAGCRVPQVGHELPEITLIPQALQVLIDQQLIGIMVAVLDGGSQVLHRIFVPISRRGCHQ
jgi:hypothetical protein